MPNKKRSAMNKHHGTQREQLVTVFQRVDGKTNNKKWERYVVTKKGFVSIWGVNQRGFRFAQRIYVDKDLTGSTYKKRIHASNEFLIKGNRTSVKSFFFDGTIDLKTGKGKGIHGSIFHVNQMNLKKQKIGQRNDLIRELQGWANAYSVEFDSGLSKGFPKYKREKRRPKVKSQFLW